MCHALMLRKFYFSSSSVVSFSACIWCSGIILTPWATFVPNFVSVVAPVDKLAHRKKLCIHSLTHSLTQLIHAPGTKALASEKQHDKVH